MHISAKESHRGIVLSLYAAECYNFLSLVVTLYCIKKKTLAENLPLLTTVIDAYDVNYVYVTSPLK